MGNKKTKKWDVFYNKKRKHPGITIREKHNKWINIGLTHKFKNSPYLVELESNPNREYKRKAYVFSKLYYDHSNNKGKKYIKFKISDKDKGKIKTSIRLNKKS